MESGIVTKRTGNLMKENEALKVALAKATSKIHALRVEKSLLLSHILRHCPTASIKSEALEEKTCEDVESNPESTLQEESSLAAIQSRITKSLLQTFHIFPVSSASASSDPFSQSSFGTSRRKKPAADLKKVPFDDEGRPILPLHLGILMIHSLGICQRDKPAFNSKRYTWPLGFLSSRSYASYLDANATCTYFSRVSASADGNSPKFEVWMEDEPERIFSASTPTGAWSSVIRLVNEIRGKETASNSASGPDLFGFSNPIVNRLLLEEMNKA